MFPSFILSKKVNKGEDELKCLDVSENSDVSNDEKFDNCSHLHSRSSFASKLVLVQEDDSIYSIALPIAISGELAINGWDSEFDFKYSGAMMIFDVVHCI